MHRRLIAAAMAGVLSVSVAPSLHAAPFAFHHSPAQGKAVAGKMVSFSVRNDSKSTLVLQAGEQQISIDPGKTAKLKLAEGAQITNVNATEKRAAGSVVATVGKELDGNTLAVS